MISPQLYFITVKFQDEDGVERKTKKKDRSKTKGENEKDADGVKKEKKKKKKITEEEEEGMDDLEKFLADEKSGGAYESF